MNLIKLAKKKRNMTLKEFADAIKQPTVIVIKLDRCILSDVPQDVVETIARVLDIPSEIVRDYVDHEPVPSKTFHGLLHHRSQTWQEAIETL